MMLPAVVGLLQTVLRVATSGNRDFSDFGYDNRRFATFFFATIA
jgi:hypothetical protein